MWLSCWGVRLDAGQIMGTCNYHHQRACGFARPFVVVAVALAALLLTACTDAQQAADQQVSAPTPTTAGTPTPTTAGTATATEEGTDETPVPEAAEAPPQSQALPDVEAALDVARAPLGTFAVAKPNAGILVERDGEQRLEIPVYSAPFGAPRTLLAVSEIDGRVLARHLTNVDPEQGARVFRVIAGGPNDDWLKVQAPSRPHDRYVWIRSSDVDLGYTDRRIEIDLARQGELRVVSDAGVLFAAPIVQGRESRPTPHHLTYLENGVASTDISPAYGLGLLSIASFSEVLASYGGDREPTNFIHGTLQPELLGQRVSSGSIRMANEALAELVSLVTPGTPVMLFDGPVGRAEVLEREPVLADTAAFGEGIEPASDVSTGAPPQFWNRCALGGSATELCLHHDAPDAISRVPVVHEFAVAKTDAGVDRVTVDEQGREQTVRMIPVFDEPGGNERALVYINPVDGLTQGFPLYATTPFGEPLVLSILERSVDGKWLRVNAPVLPHGGSVWVRASDFEQRATDVRIEVDIATDDEWHTGQLSVWRGSELLVATEISAGREARETVTIATYVDQRLSVEEPSDGYGPWILSTPTFSETLPTFGGGGLPQQSIHGVPDAVAIGRPASSGSIHIAMSAIELIAAFDGIVGARVVIFDSSIGQRAEDLLLHDKNPASTIPFDEVTIEPPAASFT